MRLKVMTFNLRVRVESDGANCFDNRREKIVSLIEGERPDVIGFQEATEGMTDFLKERLTDYTFVGYGRNESYRGEGVPIAFRKDRFALGGFSQEWLSFTPQKPASRLMGLDQSACPRVFAYADLICAENGKLFTFYNIHTDHMGTYARVVECAFLLRTISERGGVYAVTGDFNALPDSPEITMIRETRDALGTVDATEGIKGSFHGFKGDVGEHKIDYIFTNLPTDPAESYAIPDDDTCGCYYSDHNALCAWVELN